MAIVFISPKQRQKVFFMGITIMFLLLLAIVSFVIFLSQPKQVSPQLVFNKPKVSIDFKILDSDQFKKLESFAEMEVEYNYRANTRAGKTIEGMISAVSEEAARKILQGRDLTVTYLKEVEPGRDNPFIPYYEPAPAPIIIE